MNWLSLFGILGGIVEKIRENLLGVLRIGCGNCVLRPRGVDPLPGV
jgi:hypothetical protein